jgi:hypothetical protein
MYLEILPCQAKFVAELAISPILLSIVLSKKQDSLIVIHLSVGRILNIPLLRAPFRDISNKLLYFGLSKMNFIETLIPLKM